MHRMGIDLGKSIVKGTCNGEVIIEFPPLVATPSADRMLLDHDASRMEVRWDRRAWLIGENVSMGRHPRWVTDEHKIGPDAVALALAALGRLGLQGPVAVCAGVPAGLWRGDGKALQRLLAGSYEYEWNSQRRRLTIEAIVMPEPMGTYFSQILSSTGGIADPALMHAPVAIVDVGYRSVDIVLVQEGTVRQDVIRSSAHGLVMAFDHLYAEVASQIGLLSDDEKLELFLAVVRNKPAVLKGRRLSADLDVHAVLDDVKGDVAEVVIGDVRSALAGINYQHLLWTGGGAEWLREPLERAFPGTRWVNEPRLANVRGFYRYVTLALSRRRRTTADAGASH